MSGSPFAASSAAFNIGGGAGLIVRLSSVVTLEPCIGKRFADIDIQSGNARQGGPIQKIFGLYSPGGPPNPRGNRVLLPPAT